MTSPSTSPAPPGIAKRYQDGYTTSRIIVLVGNIVKVLGVLAGVVVALAGISAQGQLGGGGQGVSLFAGILVALYGFLSGVFVSAIGQILKATLDSAVHTSPFLSNDERAKIMGLI